MTTRTLQKLKKDLKAYVSDIAFGIGRSERKFWCQTYLRVTGLGFLYQVI